jgi:hypothetical protein
MVFIRIWKPNPYAIFKYKSTLEFGNQTPTKFVNINLDWDLETKPLQNF